MSIIISCSTRAHRSLQQRGSIKISPSNHLDCLRLDRCYFDFCGDHQCFTNQITEQYVTNNNTSCLTLDHWSGLKQSNKTVNQKAIHKRLSQVVLIDMMKVDDDYGGRLLSWCDQRLRYHYPQSRGDISRL